MPIIAVCPYCQIGRVRAPERAIGATASCPRCHSSFTVVDSGETEEIARQRVSAAPSVPAPAPEPVSQAHVATTPLETTAIVTVPRPVPIPVVSPVVIDDDEDETTADPARVATVVAFLLAGIGLLAAQFPYGRFGTVGATIVGGILAAAATFGARRPVYPAVAATINGLVLLVALLLPGWLGLAPWRPVRTAEDAKTVQVVSTEGLQKAQSEWVDVGEVWQFDDVRVKATATLWPIDLIGPKGQPARSRRNYLSVRVHIANVGVAREIPFQGWDVSAVKLKDSAGTAVPPARFDSGWMPAESANKTAKLTPGKSADWLLLFEAPAAQTEYLRLELPGAPCGVPDSPIRFQISARSLGLKPTQESKP